MFLLRPGSPELDDLLSAHSAVPSFCFPCAVSCASGYFGVDLELVFSFLDIDVKVFCKLLHLLHFFLRPPLFSGTTRGAAIDPTGQHVFIQYRMIKNASRRPETGRFIYAPPSIPHILAAHSATNGSNGFPTLSPPNPPSSFFSLVAAPYVVLTRCAPSSH